MSSRRQLPARILLCAALTFAAAVSVASAQGTNGNSSARGRSSARPRAAAQTGGTRTQIQAADAGKKQDALSEQLVNETRLFNKTRRLLDEKTRELEQVRRQQDGARAGQNQPGPPGFFTYVSAFAPGLSALLSLLAVLYIVYQQRQMEDRLEAARAPSEDLRGRLERAEEALKARQQDERTSNSQELARGGSATPVGGQTLTPEAAKTQGGRWSRAADGLTKAARSSTLAEEPATTPVLLQSMASTEREEGTGSPNSGNARRSVVDSGPDPAAAPLPAAPELPPAPAKPSGDIVTDYNIARAMGDDGPGWFKTAYRDWVGLSCTNINDLLINPKAVLLFQPEGRDSFLGVGYRGEKLLVPALEWDLSASAPYMKGVFDVPSPITGGLVLAKAAVIEPNGELWQLKESGVIRLG